MSGLAPKLRFKQDDGSAFPEWEEKRLEDVVHAVNSGLTIDQNEVRSGYKVTRIETISDGSVNLSKVGYVDTNSDISSYLLNEGDILFSNINSVKHIGKIALINNERELYHGMNLLRIIPSEKMNSFFLYTYLKTTPIKRYFERVCNQAVSQASINQTELKKTKVVIPSLPEQQKIADFLSSVDAKIDAVKRKCDAFERYKKGLMQQIFSQKIRFKQDDGSDFPGWEEKRLGDFCKILSGHPVSSENIQEIKNGIPLLRGANISEGFIRHSPEIDRYFEAYTKKLSRFILETGDIVIGMDGSKVGKNIAIIKQNDAGSFLIQRVARLRSDHTNDLRYVYQHLISQRFRQYVDIVNTSSGIPHISLKQISDFEIPMPHSKEQQKIADFLSSVDVKIDAIKTQVEKLEAFKKGLLQQMFV